MAQRSIRAVEAARAAHAAQEGDVNTLYILLGEDPFILDKMDRVPFLETPLHVASSAGQTHFAIEIMILKPSFARKLNQNGLTPLHLAVTNGHIETVRRLLAMDHDLARVKGREGKTPLHCAAVGGNTNVLSELISCCPDSIKELTIGRETALHVAVKNKKFEAFKVLVEGLMRSPYKEEFLNMKDDDGNTILHLATSRRQLQTVELLLSRESDSRMVVEVNAMDADSRTCLDILLNSPNGPNRAEIEEILRQAKAVKAEDIPMTKETAPKSRLLIWADYFRLQIDGNMSNGIRNVQLVVAVLVATATFQIGISPPGGFWQETNKTSPAHLAGHPIMSSDQLFADLFATFIMIGFLVSMFIIYLLTKGFPLRPLLLIAQASMLCSYAFSLYCVSKKIFWVYTVVVSMFLVTCRVLSPAVKYIKKGRGGPSVDGGRASA